MCKFWNETADNWFIKFNRTFPLMGKKDQTIKEDAFYR